jgi:hypothetical protein
LRGASGPALLRRAQFDAAGHHRLERFGPDQPASGKRAAKAPQIARREHQAACGPCRQKPDVAGEIGRLHIEPLGIATVAAAGFLGEPRGHFLVMALAHQPRTVGAVAEELGWPLLSAWRLVRRAVALGLIEERGQVPRRAFSRSSMN